MTTTIQTTSLHQTRWRYSAFVIHGIVYWYLTSLVVLIAAYFGHNFVKQSPDHVHEFSYTGDLWDKLTSWDGSAYKAIVENGYAFDPATQSNVAFFPLFPLLAAGCQQVFGLRTEVALVIVSQAFLALSFILLLIYLDDRFPAEGSTLGNQALIALGLFPTSFYFRMAYTESLFLCLTIAALLGMRKNWPFWIVALVIGAATATRLVGVCLILPLAIEVWRRSSSRLRCFLTTGALMPLACSGLIAFMAFQAWKFDDPLAFVKTQRHWSMREAPPAEMVFAELTLEPLRAVYDADCECYWAKRPPHDTPLFSMAFANPMYWLAALAIIALGVWKRWLTSQEIALAVALLLVPYFLQSFRFCMLSQARFSIVIFPIYIVNARVLASLPREAAMGLIAFCTLALTIHTAMFVASYAYY